MIESIIIVRPCTAVVLAMTSAMPIGLRGCGGCVCVCGLSLESSVVPLLADESPCVLALLLPAEEAVLFWFELGGDTRGRSDAMVGVFRKPVKSSSRIRRNFVFCRRGIMTRCSTGMGRD